MIVATYKLLTPDRRLSPNRVVNVYRIERNNLRRENRETTKLLILGSGLPRPGLAVAYVQAQIFMKHRNYRLDGDNALSWLKSVFDGMTDAGVFSDDKRLAHFPVIQTVDRSRDGEVEVTVADQPGDLQVNLDFGFTEEETAPTDDWPRREFLGRNGEFPTQMPATHRKRILAGGHPMGGPVSTVKAARCGNCRHLRRRSVARVYLKCGRSTMSYGALTDVRAKWPGCSYWEREDDDAV